MPAIAPALKPGLDSGSTSGILEPIVAFRHSRNVMFSIGGRVVSRICDNDDVFEAGIFEGNAAVLLYPSSESAKLEPR